MFQAQIAKVAEKQSQQTEKVAEICHFCTRLLKHPPPSPSIPIIFWNFLPGCSSAFAAASRRCRPARRQMKPFEEF